MTNETKRETMPETISVFKTGKRMHIQETPAALIYPTYLYILKSTHDAEIAAVEKRAFERAMEVAYAAPDKATACQAIRALAEQKEGTR